MKASVAMMSASGILGYGFPEESMAAALRQRPDMIGVDGGSSTIRRLIPSGEIGDTDVYGAQQHAPLLVLELPLSAE